MRPPPKRKPSPRKKKITLKDKLITSAFKMSKGHCVPKKGHRIKIKKLDNMDGTSWVRALHCLNKCGMFKNMKGCELVYDSKFKGCIVHLRPVVSGNGSPKAHCFMLKKNSSALRSFWMHRKTL